MRADPTDRIIHFDQPEVSPVSVPRIFAVGLALPFAHPIRLVLASILPAALIAALGFGPIQRIIGFWQSFLAAPMFNIDPAAPASGTATMPPPALPPDITGDFAKL